MYTIQPITQVLGIGVGLVEAPSSHPNVCICSMDSETSYASHQHMTQELEQRKPEVSFCPQSKPYLTRRLEATISRNGNMPGKSNWEAKQGHVLFKAHRPAH